MNKLEIIQKAVLAVPGVKRYLSPGALKLTMSPRSEIERKLARLIMIIDRAALAEIEKTGGAVGDAFWVRYQDDLKKQIASPLRQHIEQSFTSYSDYVNFIDKTGAIDDIDTDMTGAIAKTAREITENSRARLDALIAEGLSDDEIVESIATRFSSGHAEQVAVTELTRAEGYFAEALQARLTEQGVTSQIRWLTSEDEKVCPICGPADHALKNQPIETKRGGWNGQTWGDRFGQPPAHPNCRCQTVVELSRG